MAMPVHPIWYWLVILINNIGKWVEFCAILISADQLQNFIVQPPVDNLIIPSVLAKLNDVFNWILTRFLYLRITQWKTAGMSATSALS